MGHALSPEHVTQLTISLVPVSRGNTSKSLKMKNMEDLPLFRKMGNTVLCFENILSFPDSDHFFNVVPISGSEVNSL